MCYCSPQKKKNSVNTALMSSSKDKKEVETVKPKKDKNAPKQAKNSYLFFVELVRGFECVCGLSG